MVKRRPGNLPPDCGVTAPRLRDVDRIAADPPIVIAGLDPAIATQRPHNPDMAFGSSQRASGTGKALPVSSAAGHQSQSIAETTEGDDASPRKPVSADIP